MTDKLVSVIIPTYNRSNLIRETIATVLNQTYQNFELLLIDDGSHDNTKDIIQSFKDKRIKYFFQAHTGLPASGRNTGLKRVQGDFIAFLDSDDLWFPRKLEIQVKLLNKMPNILLIATNGFFFPKKPHKKVLELKKNTLLSFRQLLENNIIINSSVLMKKAVFSKIGLLDESQNLKYGEDYDYWLRLLKFKDNSILIIKNILVKYRDTTNKMINLYKNPNFFIKKYRILSHIFEKHKDLEKNYVSDLLRDLLFNYQISKIREEIIIKRKGIFKILKIKSLKIDKKLFFFLDFLIIKFKLLYLIKKVKIFNRIVNYFKILIFKFFKVIH